MKCWKRNPYSLLLQVNSLINVGFCTVYVATLKQASPGLAAVHHKVTSLMSNAHFLSDHSSTWPFSPRKTWMKYQMEIQSFSVMVLLLVQLFTLMHSKGWLRCLILHPSLPAYFAVRHFRCKAAHTLPPFAGHSMHGAHNFTWRHSQQHFLKTRGLCATITINVITMSVIHVYMGLSIWRMELGLKYNT